MDSQQFITDAIKTEAKPESLGLHLGATLQVLQFLVAAGNVADAIKRGIYYGKGLDAQRLRDALNEADRTLDAIYRSQERLSVPEDSVTVFTAPNLRLLHGALGIFGESGEMVEALVKQIKEGKLDIVNFGEETGDVDWYKAIIHDETGLSEETTRAAVIAKLKLRYPGKFDADGAAVRDLEAERLVLSKIMQGDDSAAVQDTKAD